MEEDTKGAGILDKRDQAKRSFKSLSAFLEVKKRWTSSAVPILTK